MKKLFLILLFSTGSLLFGQKNISLNVGSGVLLVKNNSGINYDAGITYDVSPRTGIYASYNYALITVTGTGDRSDLNRFQVGGFYRLLNGSTQISSVVGFSVLSANDLTIIDRKTTLATDLGLVMLFNADKKFSYGIKWLNTFSPSANGGIMQANICFNYRL
ncbi:hypothetical protein [Chryseobacterium sp.]|uniref:hypothetical protein n=1 Tax=Chryseobacterium sp. TaxID=1871047 RepID=UPI0011C71952|nr:hypothetical protein [Chryseobacterium sp.]TXF78985.1 hypothetical protein FUA25_00910 [Chryseobacterium sp.]